MNRLNRRRFLALGAASSASVVLVACGNESPADVDLNPTQMPDVAGAPPTLAPITSTPQAQQGGGEEQAAGGDEGAAGGAAGVVEIEAGDLYYDPTDVELAPGDTVVMNNAGMLQHNLVIEDWDNEEVIPLINGGESAEWTVPDDVEIGSSVVYYCSVPGHREAGMEGTFTFVEASAAAAGGEEEAAAEGEEAAAGGGGAATHDLEAGDIYYDQTELELAPGQTLVMHNAGMLQHDFVIEDWGDEEVIPLLNGGETGEWTVPDDVEIGSTVVYYCSVPGHRQAGMEGTLTFVEAAAGGGEQDAAAAAGAPEEEAGTPAAEGEGEEAAAAGDASDPTNVTVVATEWAFEPADFEVVPGGTIMLVNEGTVGHGMAAEALGGGFLGPVRAGDSAQYRVPSDAQPGDTIEYTAINSSAAELGMGGTITIIEGEGGEAAAAASPEASPAATPEAAAAGGGGGAEPLTILALDSLAFDPSEAEVSPGQTIILQNDGFLQHDIAVDEWGGALTDLLNNGETGEFTIPEDVAEGEQYVYYCTVAGHRQGGMEGIFTIVGGAAAQASPAATPAASPAASPEAAASGGSGGGNVIEVQALDTFQFDPAEFEVSAGDTIRVTNAGFLEHDFQVDEWDGDETEYLLNGQSADVVVPDSVEPGEQYEFYCSVAGHRPAGMEGVLTIV